MSSIVVFRAKANPVFTTYAVSDSAEDKLTRGAPRVL